MHTNRMIHSFVMAVMGLLVGLGAASASAQTPPADAVKPPDLTYLPAKAYHVLPETHNNESGYSSLCIGKNGKVYIGTTKYGVNAYRRVRSRYRAPAHRH